MANDMYETDSVRQELLAPSDVPSLKLRDRDGFDTQCLDDFEQEGNARDKRRRALFFSSALCAAFATLGIFLAVIMKGRGTNDEWATVGAWGSPTEEFKSIGVGMCGDRFGNVLLPADLLDINESSNIISAFSPAAVSVNGSSEECQRKCAEQDDCNGFMTYSGNLFGPRKGGCRLVLESEGYPSSHNGNMSFFCFWRHKFKFNSEGIYKPPRPAVPKLLWSYWEVMDTQFDSEEAKVKSVKTKAFLSLCHESWRKLNPGWEVILLDQHSLWQHISMEDLPAGFDQLSIQHKSDAIRLAVIVKYGGVWLDASTLLLQPLSSLVGDDPNIRTFYVNLGLVGQPVINARFRGYTRYSANFHVENWFFAAPPQDPFMVRTSNCVKRMHAVDDTKDLKDYPDLFSPRQLEDLDALGEWSYLATDVCMYKVLDEDAALTRWWLSTRVRRINFLGHLEPRWFAEPEEAFVMLFRQVTPDMVSVLTGGDLHLLKFTGGMRNAMLQAVTPKELWGCDASSWSSTLSSVGILDVPKCLQLSNAADNSWNNTV
eukprot:TRINITY_DN7209_c1_g1_i1.p1 TRINITY_DN7209_c1_g1~~TRINITY_DN7209_c1_g1_i1.p1  ORF type:complete len:543 (+),score=89.14 TRINITY_DN7209_c1_g1_i1:116-1744(+)